MNYEWYETRTTAKIIAYPIKEEEVQKIEKQKGYLHIKTKDRSYDIKIVHPYTVVGYEQKANERIEVSLEKPYSKKWTNLESDPVLEFDRQKQIPEQKEAHSSDSMLNMFMDVYENASAEGKREMNRSFYQSGGTELRTYNTDPEGSKRSHTRE